MEHYTNVDIVVEIREDLVLPSGYAGLNRQKTQLNIINAIDTVVWGMFPARTTEVRIVPNGSNDPIEIEGRWVSVDEGITIVDVVQAHIDRWIALGREWEVPGATVAEEAPDWLPDAEWLRDLSDQAEAALQSAKQAADTNERWCAREFWGAIQTATMTLQRQAQKGYQP